MINRIFLDIKMSNCHKQHHKSLNQTLSQINSISSSALVFSGSTKLQLAP